MLGSFARHMLAASVFLAAPVCGAQAATYTVLHNFVKATDGGTPSAGVVRDSAGNLYGTASAGGTGNHGTAFKLAPDGTYTVLHNFVTADGIAPKAGLVLDSAGNLYGTASGGGANNAGTLFKLAPDGTFTVLYNFNPNVHEKVPKGDLTLDSAGNLYGVSGSGTVFKVTLAGAYSLVYALNTIGSTGWMPQGGLLKDGAGNIYGTTLQAGTGSCSGGCGIVYQLTPGGTEIVLHSFDTADGTGPNGGLISDSAGNLYGTTTLGGSLGYGTIFKLAPDGTFTVLYNFTGQTNSYSLAGVIADSAGNLYGTSEYGGNGWNGYLLSGKGTLFKLKADGTMATPIFHKFTGKADGSKPIAGLFADGAGNFYGTTSTGGSGNAGVVFKITP